MQETTLTVRGAGEIELDPDLVRTDIRVESFAETADKAKARRDESWLKISEILNKKGLPKEQLKISGSSLVSHTDPKAGEKKGCLASMNGHVETSLSEFPLDFVSEALAAIEGVSTHLSFHCSKKEGADKEALKLAIRNASSQAETAAAEFGLKVSGIKDIQIFSYPAAQPAMLLSAREDSSLTPAKIKVSAEISVTYILTD